MTEVEADPILEEDELDSDLAGIVDPLVGKIEAITAQMNEETVRHRTAQGEENARHKKTMDKLRKKRVRYVGVVRSLEPEKAPSLYGNRKNGRKKGGATKGKPVGHALQVQAEYRERLEKLTDWLQENRDGLNAMSTGNIKGFRAIDIADRLPANLIGTQLTKMLGHLHDDGILRLEVYKRGADHSKTGGMPSGKFYKVV